MEVRGSGHTKSEVVNCGPQGFSQRTGSDSQQRIFQNSCSGHWQSNVVGYCSRVPSESVVCSVDSAWGISAGCQSSCGVGSSWRVVCGDDSAWGVIVEVGRNHSAWTQTVVEGSGDHSAWRVVLVYGGVSSGWRVSVGVNSRVDQRISNGSVASKRTVMA